MVKVYQINIGCHADIFHYIIIMKLYFKDKLKQANLPRNIKILIQLMHIILPHIYSNRKI